MDIKKSFTYTFQEDKWHKNMLVGAGIAFPLCLAEYLMNAAGKDPFSFPYMLICLIYGICTIIVGIFLNGYLCVNSYYRLNNADSAPIKWTNLDIILISGIKSFFANLIYKIPLLIILLFGLLFSFTAMFDINNPNPGANYTFTLKLVNAIAYLIEIFIIPSFITDLKFSSFFNFKKIGELIKNNASGFLVLILISLLVIGGYTICKIVLHTPAILWILIDSILTFYIVTIKSDLITQFVKEAQINK